MTVWLMNNELESTWKTSFKALPRRFTVATLKNNVKRRSWQPGSKSRPCTSWIRGRRANRSAVNYLWCNFSASPTTMKQNPCVSPRSSRPVYLVLAREHVRLTPHKGTYVRRYGCLQYCLVLMRRAISCGTTAVNSPKDEWRQTFHLMISSLRII
jgi:hypothetical protein